MLDTIIEYRKGILFIRLIGSLTKETIDKLNDINNIIKENEIRNIVINMNELKSIDIKGINTLFYIYELCKKNKGRILICEAKNDEVRKRLKNSRILNYIKEIKNELIAFDLIKI